MDGNKFDATMVSADWRGATPHWLWIDAVDCHKLAAAIMPPVPLIAIGDRSAPGVDIADMVADDPRGGAALGRAIDAKPVAAAATIRCLRTSADLPPLAALELESATMAALQGGAEHEAWRATRTGSPALPPGKVALSRSDQWLDVQLVRPTAYNAIDRAMRDDLFEVFALAAADDTIRAIRLTAAGRCFSIGADLAEFGTTLDPAEAHLIRLRSLPALPLLRRHGRFEVTVQGACIGAGLELAAFADRLSATRDAWFQLPELGMGILPGFGGTVSLARRIGRQRAAELIVSGRRVSACTALAVGLVDEIVDNVATNDRSADVFGR